MATLVTVGLNVLARLAGGDGATDGFRYIALGSGTTEESTSQTTLVTEFTSGGLARASAVVTYPSTGKVQWYRGWEATSDSLSVTEVGVFSATSGGTMLMRHKFASAKTLDTGDEITVTISLTLSRA